MLTREENERLTRTGPGTPMGELMRRYWLPACLSSELETDGEPRRLRLLGEDLVAFRDTSGQVGLLDEYCPHRGVSLAYGRNEECGLRCLYHGWKVDREGRIVDMPSEAGESDFKDRIRHVAYTVREQAGVVWAYLGPPGSEPDLPQWEWMAAPPERLDITKVVQDCNFLQGVEGSIDSAHSDFLHSSEIRGRPRDHRPRIEVQDTDFGFCYAALRTPDEGGEVVQSVRVTLWLPPCYVLIPPQRRGSEEVTVHQAWVPIDDEHNTFYSFRLCRTGPMRGRHSDQFQLNADFRPRRNRANKHLQDREAMKHGDWAGIPGVNSQDFAMVESARPIIDRSREHLGTSDIAVIHMRHWLLRALRQFADGGQVPGRIPAAAYGQLRSRDDLLPRSTPWRSTLAEAVSSY
jgi:phthalate 4,5-dioxygenase oxygenase subunit